MATALKNLNESNSEPNGNYSHNKIGVVVSEWNEEITSKLLNGAMESLKKYGVWESNIEVILVPGSFELTFGAQKLAQKEEIDGVITLGCVIKGETSHNEYINSAVAQGLTNMGIATGRPFIFGLLTPNDEQQAIDRAGGKYGNKGVEAATTAIRMAALKEELKSAGKQSIGY